MSEVSEMRVRPRADAARLRIWDAPVLLPTTPQARRKKSSASTQ
jgi:hypothetical protein